MEITCVSQSWAAVMSLPAAVQQLSRCLTPRFHSCWLQEAQKQKKAGERQQEASQQETPAEANGTPPAKGVQPPPDPDPQVLAGSLAGLGAVLPQHCTLLGQLRSKTSADTQLKLALRRSAMCSQCPCS